MLPELRHSFRLWSDALQLSRRAMTPVPEVSDEHEEGEYDES